MVILTFPAVTGGGVKYGDAVAAIVTRADLDRIRSELDLDRFSVIAAIRLGATDGRELIMTEPLSDSVLGKVADACEAGGFCPDPYGFVAARVHIVVLLDGRVHRLIGVDTEVRNGVGRLFDLETIGVEGDLIGWHGWADEDPDHVALGLVPITESGDGRVGEGIDPPLLLKWNPAGGRFQLYDCVAGENDETVCEFVEEERGT